MSEQFLATASVRIVPDTTGFAAALQAEVIAATRTVKIPAASSAAAAGAAAGLTAAQKAQTVATNQLVGATEILNVTKKQQASLDKIAADAAKIEADALHASAAAAREAALAHDQLSRGIGTATASQFGLRGAVLASSGPFLAGVVGVEIFRKAIDEASAEAEAHARVQKILGAALAESSKGWAENQAAIGLSTTAALKAEGALATVFRVVHVGTAESAKLSQQLVERAVDVAARANVPVETALKGFQLGIAGNLRSLRQFGVLIKATDVNQEALRRSGKASTDELNRQDLVRARANLLLRDTALAAGAASDRSGDLAQQQKVLTSNLANLGAILGSAVIPPLSLLIGDLTLFVQVAQKVARLPAKIPFLDSIAGFVDKHKDLKRDLISTLLFPPLGPAIAFAEGVKAGATALGLIGGQAATAATQLQQVNGVIEQLNASTSAGRDAFGNMVGPINLVTGALQGAAGAAGRFIAEMAAIGAATADLVNLGNRLLAQQIAGASSGAQIGTLKAQIAANRKILAELGGPRGARGRAALAAIAAETAQIRAIQAADAAAAKAAQSAAESAASKAKAAAEAAARAAQQALDAQDAALAFRQQFAQGQLSIAAATAAGTKSLTDDIANLRDQLSLTEQQVVEAGKIHDAQTRLNTIQQLQLQAVTLQNQIDDAIAQQRQNIRDRKVAAAEAKVTIAGLDAQLAETLGHPQDRIAALRRQNAALEEEKKLWQGNGVKLREIRNQIAENNKTIKDMQGEQKKGSQLAFDFLVAQQGFAANLLSNLLPVSATAGTVGGAVRTSAGGGGSSNINTPTGPSGSSGGGALPDVTTDVRVDAQTSAGPAGVTSGQMATLIHVQRQMLQVMFRLVGQRTHPEATHQRTVEAVGLDTIR